MWPMLDNYEGKVSITKHCRAHEPPESAYILAPYLRVRQH